MGCRGHRAHNCAGESDQLDMSLFQGPREVLVLPLLDDAVGGSIMRNGSCVFHICVVWAGGDDGIVGLVEHCTTDGIQRARKFGLYLLYLLFIHHIRTHRYERGAFGRSDLNEGYRRKRRNGIVFRDGPACGV